MIAVTEYLVNEEIRDREVRLIGENGEQLGIMSSAAALNIAVEKDLDLVKIAPGSNPPVCKIMDYGKYRFEQSKREKEARKNQRVIEIKEIRMSPEHRRERLSREAAKTARSSWPTATGLRSRSVSAAARWRTPTSASSFCATLPRKCAELANLDKQPKLEGRNMSIFLSPKPQAPAKKPGRPKEEKPQPAEEAKE